MELVVTRLLVLLLVVTYGHAAPSCGIPVKDRDSCGWTGISQAECQSRGCCFDVNATTLNWCYHPTGVNPCGTNPCRSYETCVPGLSGISYTCTCPSGRLADGTCKTVDGACAVSSVLLKRPCGYKGITEAECLDNGCCFDTNAGTLYWCYRKVKDVNPCDSFPCRPTEKCVRNGAQYACTCPSGRSGVGAACNTATDSACAIDQSIRKPCGWFGISQSQCADQGCCFEVNARNMNWCFKRDVNPCANNPCKNGGACSRNGNTFSCTCSSSWAGSDCGTPNPCGSSPCKNGGACRNNGASFTCSCPALWTGADCGTPNPCGSSPCKNGGACSNNGASFTCSCPALWTGADCGTPNPCGSSPCKNGGACRNNGASFTCTCPALWTGADCGTPNPCGSSPCKNGGACSNNGASFTCTCTGGWKGIDCSADPCNPNPCLHGGTCTASGASFTCACIPGWTGSGCSTEVNVCLKSNPCKNGGTCVKFGDSYECKCPPNWAGANCDMGSAACHAVLPQNRVNCGWGGVTLAQCNGRSCCFDPMSGRPACFYAVMNCDTMDLKQRVDCGFSGISYAQCVGRGCCYDDDEETNTGPVCYRKANPECIGVAAAKRVAKGAAGIQPNECTAQGWCWDSSAVPNCFTTA